MKEQTPSASLQTIERFGDLGIIEHEWPIIGPTPNWNRDAWPVPHFVRKDPILGDLYIVEYSDSLQELCRKKASQSDAIALPKDGLAGLRSSGDSTHKTAGLGIAGEAA